MASQTESGSAEGAETSGIGAYIIGDEIISGRREDKHFAKLIEILAARGLQLDWTQYIGDDRNRLIEAFRRSFASRDIVFCFGGIGATPDDHTRQAAAAALGVDLALHPDAEREIRARYNDVYADRLDELLPRGLKMGEFPLGAGTIPNPFNRIPGFTVGHHWFVPGFPEMAWAMVEWVLDTHYAHLHHKHPVAQDAILVFGQGESILLDLMTSITEKYPNATLSSLPSFGGKGVRGHIELGLRGEPSQVSAGMAEIRAELTRRGAEWIEKLLLPAA